MKPKIYLFLGILLIILLIFVAYKTFSKILLNSHVDIVYYINLDHRQDRNTELLGELAKTDISPQKINRVSGVYKKEQGHLGCSLSHIKCIEAFIESGKDSCLVLEDDFEFAFDAYRSVFTFFNQAPKFSVCLLAANEQSTEPSDRYSGCEKVLGAMTASGYIVTREYAPVLLQNFKEGAHQLERSYATGPYDGQYAIDQYWMRLQPLGEWLLITPKVGHQRRSFSDIMGGVVDYKV
jgi:hypothetical protein